MSDDFDPKAYLQEDDGSGGGFDPKAYLAEGNHGMDVADTGGMSQAALDHFANAASFGYLPQLSAAASKLVPNPSADVDARLRAQGFKIQQPDQGYLSTRDETIARLANEGQEHPVASAIGTVGGTIAGGAATGGALRAAGLAQAANASRIGRLASGIRTGAAMGAIANPGDTEGQIDPTQLGARLGNAETGAITGGALQGVVEAIPAAAKFASAVGKKVSGALSGVPEELIDHYANRTDQINQLIKQNGGDMTAAADQIRQELSQGIQKTKDTLNGQISQALQSASTEKTIDLDPIVSRLEKQRASLLNNNQIEEANQVGSIIDKVKSFGFDKDKTYGVSQYTGKANAQGLNSIKGTLQDIATPAYQKNGQIFNYAKSSQQVAKSGAAIARKMLNSEVPEVAQANNQLASLHTVEDNLNKNLIAPGKTDAALFAAGSGSNPRNQRMLQQLGNVAGVDAAGRAKDLATAKTFANPPLLPSYSNGKSMAGLAIAAGAGHLAGPLGYVMAAPTSPAAIKAGINAGNVIGPYANALGQSVRNNMPILQRVGQAATTPPENQSSPEPFIDQKALAIFKQNPGLIESIADPKLKSALMKQMGQSAGRSPSVQAQRGPDAWVQKGIQNLGIQDQGLQQRVLADPKAKQLLMQASDLKPGSPAMKNIMNQIQKGWGSK